MVLKNRRFSSDIDTKKYDQLFNKPVSGEIDRPDYKEQLGQIKRGFLDRTAWGAGVNLFQSAQFTELDNNDYVAELDPQVPDDILFNYPRLLDGSNSSEETNYRLKKHEQKKIDQESDLFNITSVVSEFLFDPVALMAMSAPVRGVIFGAKSKQVSRIVTSVQAEEVFKQAGDPERPFVDAVVVGTVGSVIKRLNKRFSKYDTEKEKIDLNKWDSRSEIPTTKESSLDQLINKKENIKPINKWSVKEFTDDVIQRIAKEYKDLDIVKGKINKIVTATNIVRKSKFQKDVFYNPVVYENKTGVMYVDMPFIIKEFRNKAWTKKHPFFDKPLAKDTFKNLGDWIEFNLRRPLVSKNIRLNNFSKKPGTLRKNQINKLVFSDIADAKVVNKNGSTMLDDASIKNSQDNNQILFNNDLTKVADEDLELKKTLFGLEKIGLSPIDKILGSTSRLGKEFILNLTKSDLYHKFQDKLPMVDSVEAIMNTLFSPRLFNGLKTLEINYLAYIKEATGKDIKWFKKARLMSTLNKTRKPPNSDDLILGFDDFSTQIYRTINNGMKTDTTGITNKYVIQASNDVKTQFFDLYKKDITETGLYLVPFIKREDYLNSILTKFPTQKGLGNSKWKDPKTKETWTRNEVENAIKDNTKAMKEATGIRDNYLPQLYRRVNIEKNFPMFEKILRKRMTELRFTSQQQTEILDDFKVYNPFQPPAKFTQSTTEGLQFQLKNVPVSKFLKQRSLILDEATRDDLIKNDFLETRLETLMSYYYRSMTPEIVMTQKYGDPGGYGWFYNASNKSFAPGIIQVSEEFELAIQKAKGKSAKQELLNERNIILDRLEDMRDMRKGLYGMPDNPHSQWAANLRNFKLFNTVTQLTGASQLADIARIVVIGGMMNNFGRMFGTFSTDLLGAIQAGTKQGQLAGQVHDLTIQFTRAQILSGNDLFQGSLKGVEGSLQKLSAINFQYIQPMNPWTHIGKSMASIFGGSDIIEKIVKISRNTATQADVAFLNQKGISPSDAIKIAEKVKIHGQGKYGKKWDKNLITIANTDQWGDANLSFRFNRALNEYTDELIITPSDGSAPLIANTPIGSVFFQYKKFSLDMTRKVLLKGLQTKDTKLLQDVLALTAMGMVVDAARTPAFNRDYSKKTLREKLVDGAERGGVFGIFGDVNRIISSVSNNQIGIKPLLGIRKPYGSSVANKIGNIFGPTGSTIGTVGEIMYDWGRGRHTHHTARRIRKLVPLNNIWYLDTIMDESEKVIY